MQQSEAYSLLVRLADSIASTFGKSCETVIHEIDENEIKILYINNGSVTGRKVGDQKSILGDQASIKSIYQGKDLINYKAETRDGKLIKSTTIHLKNDDYHLAMGINFDYTMFSMANRRIKDLIKTGPEFGDVLIASIGVSIDEICKECIDELGIPISFLKKEDKYRLVEMLYKRSAFTIQGSVPSIADKLGISRYTVYNYLREIKKTEA